MRRQKAGGSETRPYSIVVRAGGSRYGNGAVVRMHASDDSARPSRRSLRLGGYDYAHAGAYFVTVCTEGKVCLFGEIVRDEMEWSHMGRIVHETWVALPEHYVDVRLDAFVVMPNHVHGVIVLTESSVGAGLRPARVPNTVRQPLSEVVRAFKGFSARRINELRGTPGKPVWQRGYYEHVIRDEDEWRRVREYIANNARRWEMDRENQHVAKVL